MVIRLRGPEGPKPTPIIPTPCGIAPAEATTSPRSTDLETEAAVQAIAFVIHNNVKRCWFSEADRQQTLKESFSVVTTALQRGGRLRITIEERTIKVNGEDLKTHSSHLEVFAQHLSDLSPCNFILKRGLTPEEFTTLTDLLSRPAAALKAEGEFTEMILRHQFAHITSRRVILREVAEDEAVVSREALEAATQREHPTIEADVLALLSGGEVGDTVAESRRGTLRRLLEDSEMMAGLVLQAATASAAGDAGSDPRKVAEMVVACLNRAFDALLKDPFSKTQKGKQAIAAALRRLEKDLLQKMNVQEGETEEHPVVSAVERMTERLKMDFIVQDYTRKLHALEESEKRILRFIKLQGWDRMQAAGLERELAEGGVDISAWHRLLALSGAHGATDADEEEEAAAAVRRLGEILQQLERDVKRADMASANAGGSPVSENVRKAAEQVRRVTEKTRQKISGWVASVQSDLEAAERMEQEAVKSGVQLKLSRKQMITVLAEIVQELCQPLSVVNCTISMLTAQSLGELTPPQLDMLNLAMESVTRIQVLVNNLERIAGQPTTLSPDTAIQKSLYAEPISYPL